MNAEFNALSIIFNFIKEIYPLHTIGIISISVGYLYGVLQRRFRLRLIEKRLELLDILIENSHGEKP